MKPVVIKSDAPKPIAIYNEGFKVGDFVFAAGQVAAILRQELPGSSNQRRFPILWVRH